MENVIIFYSLSVLIFIFAGLAIIFKNIFYSLLSAMSTFMLVGILFYILGSEYNAIVQVAVYGLAVPVILGIAIMFTDTNKEHKSEISGKLKALMFLVCGLFILSMIYLIKTSLIFNSQGFNITEEILPNSLEIIQAFSRGIFIKYVWAFELVSVILTMVIIGLIVINKRGGKEWK